MKSELKLSTPNLKVTFILGLCATVLIISLSLIFRFEFGLILFSIAGSVVLIGGTKALINFRQWRHTGRLNSIALAKEQQELRLITYEADKKELESFTITFPNTHRIVQKPDSNINLIEGVAKQLPALSSTTDNLPDLMDKIGNKYCVMFLGARGSGKSETAAHWIKHQGHLFVICDPADEDFQWPMNGRVYNDFNKIQETTIQSKNLLKRRIAIKQKSGNHFTLFFDELHTLVDNDIDVVEIAIGLAAIGRKYNIHSAFTGLAKTQDYLGVKAARLLDNFAQVRMTLEHRCYVNLGEGEFEVRHPGRYRHRVIVNRDGQIRQRIARLLLDNPEMTPYEICRQVWGNGVRAAQNGERYTIIEQVRNSL